MESEGYETAGLLFRLNLLLVFCICMTNCTEIVVGRAEASSLRRDILVSNVMIYKNAFVQEKKKAQIGW